jgi:hypothetical protein
VPSKKFKIKSQLFQTVQLRWNFPFRDISVHADNVMISQNLTAYDIKAGKEITLQDGTTIRIQNAFSWPFFKMEIHVNGHAVHESSPLSINRLLSFFF